VRRALVFWAVLAVAGCSNGLWIGDNRELARSIAAEHGFTEQRFDAGAFVLAGFARGLDGPADRLVVYIEGDGHAWLNRYNVSPDPTPWDPITLRLAVRDRASAVLYLARPCQYTSGEARRSCHPVYWTSHRFAPEVVESTSRAIDQAKRLSGAGSVRLIGYSGGGALAALVAARRSDVAGLVTIAANLDHAAWTRHHDITPLAGSENPATYAQTLQAIPQIHLAGGDDDVVPPAIVEAFVAPMTDRSRARIVVVPDYDHDCCWTRDWPHLLDREAIAGSMR